MKTDELANSAIPGSFRVRTVPSHCGSDWGAWRLDRADRVLYTEPDSHVGYRYEVDLDTCTTSAEVLDWICQIAGKGWGTPDENAATVAGLVNAFVDVLNPQANLCSGGQSKQLTPARLTHLVARSRP